MVGFIISPNVIFMPLAIAAAYSKGAVILESIIRLPLSQVPDWGLILRSSTSLPLWHVILGPEYRTAGAFPQSLDIALREPLELLCDLAIFLHQEQRWHRTDPETVAGRIAFFGLVEQRGKCHAEALVEALRGAFVILRNANHLEASARGQTLNIGGSKLANRATDFVEDQQRRSLLENLAQRFFFPGERGQQE